jgi:hypothetical protein
MPQPSAPTPSSPADVDVAILRQRFAELRRCQAAARRTLVLLAVVVIGSFAAFSYFTTNRVRDNFSQAAVQKAVADRLPAVIPLAGSELQKASLNALPVYRQLAVERYQKIQPELAAKALARLDRVPHDTGRLMSERIDASFAKVLKRIEPEVTRTFPSLTDQQKRDILAHSFQEGIAERNKAIASHIESIYVNELSAVHTALDNFQVPDAHEDPAAHDADRLQRDFLHSLLVLADYELMSGDNKPAAPAVVTRPAKKVDAAIAAPTAAAE